jgi:hypothetical protein
MQLVCCVPVIPEHFRKSSKQLEPVKLLTPMTTVKMTYTPYVEHPNLTTSPPTRYSANKNKKPASGIGT